MNDASLKFSPNLCQLVTGFIMAKERCDEVLILTVFLLLCSKLGGTVAAGHRKLCQAFDEDSLCNSDSRDRLRRFKK